MMTLMLEAAVRALAAAVLVGAGIWVLRVRNVVAQKVAWVMALGAALLMPIVMHWQILPSVVMPQIFATKSVPVLRDVTPPKTHVIYVEPQSVSSVAAFHADVPTTEAAGTEIKRPEPVQSQKPQRRNFNFLLLAEGIYFVVLAALLLRLVLGSLAAWRLWISARPVTDEELPLLTDGLKVGSVRASTRVHSPVTIGAGIVLPANFRSWSDEKLRVVLAHEESHVRQRDFYVQLAARVHAAVFWFSPLGWWLKRKLSELSETISDGAALKAARDASTYAQVLLDFAAEPRPLFAGVAMARKSNLATRIERLLNEGQFKTAFAEGRVHMYLAGVLVPLALMTVTLHVQAAVQQSNTSNTQEQTTTVQTQTTAPADEVKQEKKQIRVIVKKDDGKEETKHGFSFFNNENGEAWALVEKGDDNSSFTGDFGGDNSEKIAKARKMAKGDFFWFTHDGKSYVVDDPATIKELKEMMSQNQIFLGPDKKMLKQKFFFKTDNKEGDLVLVTPDNKNQKIIIRNKDLHVKLDVDIEKQLAAVQEVLKKIEVKLNKEEIAEINSQMADLQIKLGKIQTDVNVDVNTDVESTLQNLDKIEREINVQTDLKVLDDDKVKAITAESLKNGKARPVE